MTLYCGIDLHSNNSVVAILDEQDRTVYEKRLPNDLETITEVLCIYQLELAACVVESTYNWYWLVDGLMAAGFPVRLAHTSVLPEYSGLKYSNDFTDARQLAHLLRLGLLPTGYIYPREERALREDYQLLQTIPGVGSVLGTTIALETGTIERFASPGNYASYARCVKSEKISKKKRKGQGNKKNADKYLAWAFMEAGHYGAIWGPRIKRYYQHKQTKSHILVAKKAVANKLARACYHMLKPARCSM